MRKPSDDFILGIPSLSSIQSSVSKMHVRAPLVADPQTASESTAKRTSPEDCEVSASSTDNLSSPAGTTPSDAVPSGRSIVSADTSSPSSQTGTVDTRSRSSSPGSVHSQSSAGASSEQSPQHRPTGGAAIPTSLADLQNPKTFCMDVNPPTKRKITKASFLSQTGSIANSATSDPNDPLSQLDPLWSLKDATGKR